MLVIDQIDWTTKMERAISSAKEDSLKNAFLAEEEKVSELVELIKRPSLSRKDLRTLESLIVTDVHSRDVTQEIMQKRIRDINIFEWSSQLRHYTFMKENRRERKTRMEIKVEMIQS